MSLPAIIETGEQNVTQYNKDVTFEISYKILFSCLHSELSILQNYDRALPIGCLKSKSLKRYIEKMKDEHYPILHSRSKIVQNLFILHHTAKCLHRYNDEVLQLSYPDYRARVLYPNIIYILLRILSSSHRFLQDCIRQVYSEICRKSYGIVYSHINTFYLDHDVIKTDILYDFLGNSLRKFNPLDINNVNAFYKSNFRNIFFYYFKKQKRINTVYDSVWEIESDIEQAVGGSTRISIYRDVMYELQNKKFHNQSPTMLQLSYNYRIFKNVIISNEFQNVYFSGSGNDFVLKNSEYKLLKFFNDDMAKSETLLKIKKLPTIYKLLKCVHIINPSIRPYNEMLIKPDMVKNAVLEELLVPFKNMFSENYLFTILDKVAENFTKTILSGEYINLFTLSTVKIEQITFIEQLKKFIQICIFED